MRLDLNTLPIIGNFMDTTLSDLQPRQSALVKGFKQISPPLLRLQEQGVVAGTRIQFIRRAPLGDPYEIRVLNLLLTLREHEAASILVKVES